MIDAFSKVFDYWASGGLLLIPIGIVSFLIWIYFLGIHQYLKTIITSPHNLVELPRIEHEMTILSALVIAAPLLGLLGTVLGMTTTFRAVSQQSADTTNMVAGGISQALITTQLGLVSAIPGVFGLAYLRHMYRQLKIKIDILEKHLFLATHKFGVKT